MTKRTIFVALFASLAVAACGDARPVTNNPNPPTNNQNNPMENNPMENNPMENNPMENNPMENNPMECTGTCENNAATCDGKVLTTYSGAAFGDPPACECIQNETMTTCSDTEICDAAQGACVPDPNIACEVDMDFTGQIEGERDNEGGVFTTSDAGYADDSGLNGLWTFIQDAIAANRFVEDDENTADIDESVLVLDAAEQITITGAIVTSVSFSGRRLTFQDKQRGVLAFLTGDLPTMDAGGMPFTVEVGQELTFTVTAVQAFRNETPQISQITDITVTGADKDVGVIEASGVDITVADHWGKLVRVGGRIKEIQNENCGGNNKCYTFEHGPMGSEKTIILRSASDFIEVGECATYVGPVSSFPGPLADGASAQLDATNFDWYRGPFREQ